MDGVFSSFREIVYLRFEIESQTDIKSKTRLQWDQNLHIECVKRPEK